MVLCSMNSAVLCRGLIEAARPRRRARSNSPGIPRFYAAASLKRPKCQPPFRPRPMNSAVLCRGLIEATCARFAHRPEPAGIPRFYAAASLKRKLSVSRSPQDLICTICPHFSVAANTRCSPKLVVHANGSGWLSIQVSISLT